MKKVVHNLYPFLFAIYPILELRNLNIMYVDTASIIRPIVLSLVLTGSLWLILWQVFKNWDKAGLITTLSVLFFFSYGHVFLQIEVMYGSFPRHRYLILIFISLLILAAFFIMRKLKDPKSIVNFLTFTGGVLVIFSLSRSVLHGLSIYQRGRQRKDNGPCSKIWTAMLLFKNLIST